MDISVTASELPLALLALPELTRRVWDRGGGPEVLFAWRDAAPVLPVWWQGRIQLLPWGCKDRRGHLPLGGRAWGPALEAGEWRYLRPAEVVIVATYFCVGGTWTRARQGVAGVVAGGRVYVVTEPSSRYFTVMTRSEWAPALVGETI